MKTLGEVIEAQERCETYPNCHFCYLHSGPMCEWIRDALQYLKWYKELADDSEAFAEWKENPPLAWEEMKRMAGRPVWVEEYWAPMEDEAGVTEDEGDTEAYWAILTYADEKRISVVNGRVDQWLHKDIWNNHEVSHSWQAYRKERL